MNEAQKESHKLFIQYLKDHPMSKEKRIEEHNRITNELHANKEIDFKAIYKEYQHIKNS